MPRIAQHAVRAVAGALGRGGRCRFWRRRVYRLTVTAAFRPLVVMAFLAVMLVAVPVMVTVIVLVAAFITATPAPVIVSLTGHCRNRHEDYACQNCYK